MPKRMNKPPATETINADLEILRNVKNMDGYAPSNQNITIETLATLEQSLHQLREEFLEADRLRTEIGNRYADIAWAIHSNTLLIKSYVRSHFGTNSNEVQLVGLKKKSDYRHPARRRPQA